MYQGVVTIRIALVTTSFYPGIGGAEFVMHHLANHWQRQGHDVCVINYRTGTAAHEDALYSVQKYGMLRGASVFGSHRFPFSWYAVRAIARRLREFNPDFISAHFGYPVALWLSCLKPMPRFLVTCHGPALNETENGPRARYGLDSRVADALNRSVGAVAISSHARRVMEKIGVDPDKIIDIPNGVDCKRFRKPVSFDLRSRFSIPAGAPVILSVGRENWAKAYDNALRAFAKLLDDVPRAYYVILGKRTDTWEPLAGQLGIKDSIRFCNGLYGDDLTGAYQQADIFLSSSIKELCPLVVLEAMAAGLPEVVTDVSGSQDMVTAGYNGIVVEPGNPDALAAALRTLAGDEAMRKKYGAANLERSREYDWDVISRRYLEYA